MFYESDHGQLFNEQGSAQRNKYMYTHNHLMIIFHVNLS